MCKLHFDRGWVIGDWGWEFLFRWVKNPENLEFSSWEGRGTLDPTPCTPMVGASAQVPEQQILTYFYRWRRMCLAPRFSLQSPQKGWGLCPLQDWRRVSHPSSIGSSTSLWCSPATWYIIMHQIWKGKWYYNFPLFSLAAMYVVP